MGLQTKTVGWICPDMPTYTEWMKFYPLHSSMTSNVMHHLSKDHNITAHKTQLVGDKKPTQQDDIEQLMATPMFKHDKPRQYRLLVTRISVYYYSPFITGVYDD